MRSLGYMPNEVELEVIIQRLDMDGERCPRPPPPAVSSPFTGGWGWGMNHGGLAPPTSSHPQAPGRLQPECERLSHA